VEQLVERTTIAGETEELGENLPQHHFVPPQTPHDQVRFRTLDRSGGKPVTNRLSYGAARVFGLCLSSRIPRTRKQPFRNWICFCPQVRGKTPTLLGPLERANLNHWATHIRVRVTLQLAVYHQSGHLCNKPLETYNQ
jgi:hypothetical protein